MTDIAERQPEPTPAMGDRRADPRHDRSTSGGDGTPSGRPRSTRGVRGDVYPFGGDRAPRLRRVGVCLHGPTDAPRRRPLSRPHREQAPARLLALCPRRQGGRDERIDHSNHGDPLRPGDDRPGLVDRPAARRPRRGLPGGGGVRGRRHRPVPVRQRGRTWNISSTCSPLAPSPSWSRRTDGGGGSSPRGCAWRWRRWSSRSR